MTLKNQADCRTAEPESFSQFRLLQRKSACYLGLEEFIILRRRKPAGLDWSNLVLPLNWASFLSSATRESTHPQRISTGKDTSTLWRMSSLKKCGTTVRIPIELCGLLEDKNWGSETQVRSDECWKSAARRFVFRSNCVVCWKTKTNFLFYSTATKTNVIEKKFQCLISFQEYHTHKPRLDNTHTHTHNAPCRFTPHKLSSQSEIFGFSCRSNCFHQLCSLLAQVRWAFLPRTSRILTLVNILLSPNRMRRKQIMHMTMT